MDSKLLFLRHAESTHNQVVDEVVNKYQLVYDWDHLSKNEHFLREAKYNPTLIDCPITEKGVEQCMLAAAEVKQAQFQPDIVLVSPMLRTLMTCGIVFEGVKCPIVAEPLLRECLRSSCDWSIQMSKKKEMFPSVDFSKVKEQLWMLEGESQQNQQIYRQLAATCEGTSFDDKIQCFLAYQTNTLIYQDSHTARLRGQMIKALLIQYAAKYNRIAVVAHFNSIRFTIANKYDEKDQPIDCPVLNCKIINIDLSSL